MDGDGDRPSASGCAAVAARHGVADRVRWRVSAPDRVPAAYAAADALLFPVTWPEPWGLVPLEAMAIGRPVVVSAAAGGTGEYARAGDNALVVAPEDPGALAAAVRRLADEPGLRERLVAGGRATAAAADPGGVVRRQSVDAPAGGDAMSRPAVSVIVPFTGPAPTWPRSAGARAGSRSPPATRS